MGTKGHNKRRNAGLLWEFIVRRMSAALVEGDKRVQSAALRLLNRHFAPGTELHRELRIARALMKTADVTPATASSILGEAKTAARALDHARLDSEKGELLRAIARTFHDDSFFETPVPDYRAYATVQTLFNEWRDPARADLERLARYEDELVRRLSSARPAADDRLLNDESPGVNRLAAHIMTKRLNERYSGQLDRAQRELLRAYAFGTLAGADTTALTRRLEEARSVALSTFDRMGLDRTGEELVDLQERVGEARRAVIAEDLTKVDDALLARALSWHRLRSEVEGTAGPLAEGRDSVDASAGPRLLVSAPEFVSRTPELVKESREQNDGFIVVSGILQKADTLNQNGRVYPRAILEREVRNYQKFINERRATGECVPPDAEILTRDGWKRIDSIGDDEIVATLDVKTDEIQYQRIEERIVLPYKGPMYRFKNARTYDMLLTPNHKVVMWDRYGRPVMMTAEDMYVAHQRGDSALSHSSLRRTGVWRGETLEQVEIAGRMIDARLWAAFLGVYIAEGHCSGVYAEHRLKKHQVVVTQHDGGSADAIRGIMELLPFEFEDVVSLGGTRHDFVITDAQLHAHLLPLGGSHDKHVPCYAKGWSPALLGVLLDWMLLGDGRHRKGRGGIELSEYCTTSPRLADDVNEIMLKLGHGATVHVYDPIDRPAPDHAETSRMILAENSVPMHIVYQHSSAGISLDRRFMHSSIEDYDGSVYCVRVPNGTWLMRYNGRTCWTGNCDHPDSSVVSYKNVSHRVLEAVMDHEGVVRGRVMILNTPSGKILQDLLEGDVQLGISSRGVGSTRKQGDYVVVQEDFQLICWDFVSEPSTPGAFMLPEGARSPWIAEGRPLTRVERIDRLLGELLVR